MATTILTDQYTYLRYTLDKKWFCFCTRTNFVFSGLGEGPDLARGEGNVETSSSSEDEDSEEEAGEEGMNRQTTVNKRGLSLAAIVSVKYRNVLRYLTEELDNVRGGALKLINLFIIYR